MDDAAISEAQVILFPTEGFKAEGFIGAARGDVMVTDLELQPGKAERSCKRNHVLQHEPGNVAAACFGNNVN